MHWPQMGSGRKIYLNSELFTKTREKYIREKTLTSPVPKKYGVWWLKAMGVLVHPLEYPEPE